MSIETIVALFKDTDSSRQVLKELYEVGFKNEFWVIGDTTEGWGNESAGTNPFNSSKSQYDGATSEAAVLTRVGIPEQEAQDYMKAVGQGSVLLIGQVDGSRAQEVRDIYGRHNPVRTSQPTG
ncbi:hypothetical protein JL101_034305 (plasmid) [Skermanella rosea]|uniref:hypothetical protein n=1 Tax=Skermanella rosea TaxID=1817965 RepID=UPI001933572C|nr:hypothetical protein [Skermanella rosea]UEM07937.1 hypothetical protein JL101_034305 [Skermanella rosea]